MMHTQRWLFERLRIFNSDGLWLCCFLHRRIFRWFLRFCSDRLLACGRHRCWYLLPLCEELLWVQFCTLFFHGFGLLLFQLFKHAGLLLLDFALLFQDLLLLQRQLGHVLIELVFGLFLLGLGESSTLLEACVGRLGWCDGLLLSDIFGCLTDQLECLFLIWLSRSCIRGICAVMALIVHLKLHLELFDHVLDIREVAGRLPCRLILPEPVPLHQVLAPLPDLSLLQDLLHLIVLLVLAPLLFIVHHLSHLPAALAGLSRGLRYLKRSRGGQFLPRTLVGHPVVFPEDLIKQLFVEDVAVTHLARVDTCGSPCDLFDHY
jgi:hypothetical protein